MNHNYTGIFSRVENIRFKGTWCDLKVRTAVIWCPPPPPPRRIVGTDFPSNKSLPKALHCRTEQNGKISAIRPGPAGTNELFIILAMLERKQNHPFSQHYGGQADGKIPALFPAITDLLQGVGWGWGALLQMTSALVGML